MTYETNTPATNEKADALSGQGESALDGSVDALTLAALKRAEFAERDADKIRATEEEHKRAIDERAEQERIAEEMAPTEDEIKEIEAKKARMLEMEKWANTTGAIAEEKARQTAVAESELKDEVESSNTVDDIDLATEKFTYETSEISKEGVITSVIPGTTSTTYDHGGNGGYHKVIDDKGTTKSAANAWKEFNRSPKHIRDESLPHGEEIDYNQVPFR
ncbi:hypothetical protein H6800_02235 [Candidatus Nomurabacteria bacterium]|nr:hypothetical protein [Candidatus Nomurabacteria bacterium]